MKCSSSVVLRPCGCGCVGVWVCVFARALRVCWWVPLVITTDNGYLFKKNPNSQIIFLHFFWQNCVRLGNGTDIYAAGATTDMTPPILPAPTTAVLDQVN